MKGLLSIYHGLARGGAFAKVGQAEVAVHRIEAVRVHLHVLVVQVRPSLLARHPVLVLVIIHHILVGHRCRCLDRLVELVQVTIRPWFKTAATTAPRLRLKTSQYRRL